MYSVILNFGWLLKRVRAMENFLLGTTKKWLRPLSRSGRLTGVLLTVFYWQQFLDFDNWPLIKGRPLIGGGLIEVGMVTLHRFL